VFLTPAMLVDYCCSDKETVKVVYKELNTRIVSSLLSVVV